MRRWVLGLAAIAAVLWVWRTFSGEAAAASTETLANVGSAAEPGSGSPPLVSPPSVAASGAAANGSAQGATPAAASQPEAAFCGSLERREPAALAAGYRRLLDLDGPARAAVAAALQRAAGDDLGSRIEALGDGNAFIHSDAGRAAGRAAAAMAAKEKGEAGVRALSAVLERAMWGAIEKEDTEARAFVDEVYASMQAPLNRTLFNPEDTAGARTHKVARGESLDRIASIYRKQGILLDGLTIGLFNRVSDPTKLRADQVLKIPAQPISTVIEKRSFLMAMYLGDVIFRLFWIGHGKDDRTPETTFTVTLKQEHPDWHFDGRVIPYGHPDNILGDYFVKFEHASFQGYGAHGTPQPETVGTMASRGCIRMHDKDIREFFLTVPRGTPVHVRATQNPGSR